MGKIPIQRKVNAYSRLTPETVSDYSQLQEGPIHPSQITKNGHVLFNFVKGLAELVSETEENERAAYGVSFRGDDKKLGYCSLHSKIPQLEKVGQTMAHYLNEGDRMRELATRRTEQCEYKQVNLSDLLNADKVFANFTQGSKQPVIQNNYTKEEPKTMSDIDISDYLGGTPQRAVQQNNNTFYVNMDKTTKALLAEQIKTNKLLGILVQSVRENGVKIEELPQHIAELVAANNLPDAEIMNDAEYNAVSSADTSIDDLLP